MIASIIVNPRLRPCLYFHPLGQEPLGHVRAGSIPFLADVPAAPDKLSKRHFGSIHQLSNAPQAAHTVISELGPLISSIHGGQAVEGVPFVGSGSTWGRGSADLIQSVVGGTMIGWANLFR